MIRKYWWLVVFAVFVFLFDTLLMQWIELLITETDKCRNMNSVNPLKLVGSDSNLLIVFYVQIMPDDLVMQLHRF